MSDRTLPILAAITVSCAAALALHDLHQHYRVSIYAVPTCRHAAPIPAHAMNANPFEKDE